jgi:hypothetical protein
MKIRRMAGDLAGHSVSGCRLLRCARGGVRRGAFPALDRVARGCLRSKGIRQGVYVRKSTSSAA